MDFGIFMDFYCTRGLSQNEVFQEAFDLADMADAAGLDTVWLGESHFNPNRSVLSAPIVVAGSIAARTKRLRVRPGGHGLRNIHGLLLHQGT